VLSKLDKTVTSLLEILSPYFLLKPAHKVHTYTHTHTHVLAYMYTHTHTHTHTYTHTHIHTHTHTHTRSWSSSFAAIASTTTAVKHCSRAYCPSMRRRCSDGCLCW
jgi:hypothetical protein